MVTGHIIKFTGYKCFFTNIVNKIIMLIKFDKGFLGIDIYTCIIIVTRFAKVHILSPTNISFDQFLKFETLKLFIIAFIV